MTQDVNTDAPRTKKFWCHYAGSDGNTPKRRSIELTELGNLMPFVGEAQLCPTPLWYEKDGDWYYLYAQLDDKVAVKIPSSGLFCKRIEMVNMTDEEICENWNEERKEEEAERIVKLEKNRRDRDRDLIAHSVRMLKDYDSYLLTSATWITEYTIRAYEEVQSPVLSTLKALRKEFMARREEEERKREDENRKRREEEERKEAEEKSKEYKRITKEAEKFKSGEFISGRDVVELCRRYGIGIHLRTVHNLQQVVVKINGKEESCGFRGNKGRKPDLDGCYTAARKLYCYLQANEIY
jgi:hypothetical protein